jgi:hypothetical protein
VPIPYPNTAFARDLDKGSKKVKADGGPVALKDVSCFKTSTGDEAGNQGGNVLTHKTKGKAYFKMYSLDVLVEGKEVCRNGDSMSLNCGSNPIGGVHPAFLEKMEVAYEGEEQCDEKYDRENVEHGSPTGEQRQMVQGKPCWRCGRTSQPMIADHQPPLVVTYYSGGCNNPDQMRDAARTTNDDPSQGPAILPHCASCSEEQRREMAQFSREINKFVQGFT